MQVNIIMQKENENTLANAISNCFEKEAKKAYFFVGNFKETGYKIIEEDFIDSKTKIYFAIGIDKKNTTRGMLEGLLQYSKDVNYYSNNKANEFVSNISIFEFTNNAYMYVATSNVSESGIKSDISLYTETVYDLKDSSDKEAYKKQIKDLLKFTEEIGFEKLTKSKIDELVAAKLIFSTRQYNHSVMSISELLGKPEKVTKIKDEEKTKEVVENVVKKEVEIPKIDLSEMLDIDIDLPDEIFVAEEAPKKTKAKKVSVVEPEEELTLPEDIEELEETDQNLDKNSELYDETLEDDGIDFDSTLDINNILFSKADVKLDVAPKKSKKVKEEKVEEEDEVKKVKKVNLNNVTNLIFELPAKNSKETDAIRVPNHIRTMIPEFFGLDEAQNMEIKGTNYKVKDIEIEVVDAKNGEKQKDSKGKLVYKAGQSYLTFVTDILKNVVYEDDDIIRIIKLSEKIYHLEIISKNLQEYRVWSKLCNQKFRASTKNFGVM